MPNPYLRLAARLTLLVAAEVMIITWGNFFLTNFFDSFKKKGHISWDDTKTSERLRKMAAGLGIKMNPKRPLGIRANYHNAYAIPWTKQVIVGEILLKKLSDDELSALFGHELSHIKQNHGPFLMISAMYSAMVVAASLSTLKAPNTVIYVVSCAALFLVFSIVSRRFERAADAGAAAIVGSDTVIALLKHIVPANRWKQESETHPSIIKRIHQLRKLSVATK
jgi:Zn-dependent protease with chaperone function